ncbi:MAG TPA: hypothetical protein VN698_02335 [Bacteroidia bacterium]|nr:hypothetical protein [Bacteroidia bacterium]
METIKTNIKSKFLQVCIGISMVFISAGFFVHSISTVTASPAPVPKDFTTQGVSKIGKYQMVFDTKNTDFYLVNTETGKSMWWNKAQQLWSANCEGAPAGF